MSLFDDVVSTAKNVADTAGKKTSEFIDLTRMKMQASDIGKEITSLFEGLGRLTYDSNKSGDDAADAIAECISKLDAKQQELEEVKAKIDEFRNVKHCRTCQAKNPDDSVYCKMCGEKLD